MYLAAGEVIEAVSGKSWEEFVTERILRKVGMNNSNVTHSSAGNGNNTAATHARVDGVVRTIQPFLSDTTNPAGGVNSNAEDMAKWMMVLLAKGKMPDGSMLFSEEAAKELVTLVTPIPAPDPEPELAAQKTNFSGYALGLGLGDYRGHKIVTHSGGLPGYVSRVFLVPDISLGITVLTNQESSEAYQSIVYSIVDDYIKAPQTDWIGAYKKVQEKKASENKEKVASLATTKDPSSRPSLPFEKYAGTYVDDWYGEIVIKVEAGKMSLQFSHSPLLTGDMEHWQYDSFVVHWRDRELRADAFVTFALNHDGTVDHATMKAVSPETDFSFDFQDLYLKPMQKE